MKKKQKLFVPKWKLVLKKLKYWLFIKRPIPLFTRKVCPKCHIPWNPELFRGCPICGRGPNRVWVVVSDQQIRGVFRDPDDAEDFKKRIAVEEDDARHLDVETWEIT